MNMQIVNLDLLFQKEGTPHVYYMRFNFSNNENFYVDIFHIAQEFKLKMRYSELGIAIIANFEEYDKYDSKLPFDGPGIYRIEKANIHEKIAQNFLDFLSKYSINVIEAIFNKLKR